MNARPLRKQGLTKPGAGRLAPAPTEKRHRPSMWRVLRSCGPVQDTDLWRLLIEFINYYGIASTEGVGYSGFFEGKMSSTRDYA